MLAVFIIHLMMMIECHVFAVDRSVYKDLLRNYTNIGNGYDIFAMVIVFLIIILSVFLPKIVRLASIPVYLLMMGLIGYLILFTLNWSSKPEFNIEDRFVSAYLMIGSSTFGILLSLFFNSNELSFGTALGISIVTYLI